MATPRRLTKQEVRKAMRELQQQRELRTPQHLDPCWVHHFWRRIEK